MRLTTTLLALLIIPSLTWESTALAEDKKTDVAARAQAAEAFNRGQVLFADGEYLEAASAFERAYHLAPHASALANIGFCYDEAGDYPRAVSVFREYMKQPNPKTPEDNAKISRYLKKMKSQVGDLVINCSSATCKVTVDNAARGVTPTNLVLLAGEHSVDVVTVGGGARKHYNVTVPPGEELVLDVDLTVEFSESAAPKIRKTPPLLRAPFWVTTSVTIAGLGAVAVLGVLNYRTMQDFRESDSTDPDLERRGEKLTLGLNIAIGVTAAAATMAIIFAIIDVRRSRNQNRHRRVRRSRRLNMTLGGSALVFTF